MWPDLWKGNIIAHFQIPFYYIFCNQHTQIHVLAKFQLCILKCFEVTALKSSSNRKIDLYSKFTENKPQALPKMDVTFEWSEVQTWILYHHVCHEPRNGLLGKLFPILSFFTTNKVEIHEESLIASNHFYVTWTNGHILQFFWTTAIKQRFSSYSWLGKCNDTQVLTIGSFLH